jgi:hypothetical protein
MRLVEVVMLMGAHCVSPVEHTQMMTDAAKVQCAVVIEKDTDTGTMTVTPGGAANDPQVVAAIERFRVAPVDPLTGGGTKIVPAWAPAGTPPVEIKPPAVKASAMPEPIVPPTDERSIATPGPAPTPPAPAPAATAASPVAADPAPARAAAATKPAAPRETKVATLAPPPQKRQAAKPAPAKVAPATRQPAAAKQSAQCKGTAVAKWYKSGDGHRKYRCVKPTGDGAPAQLY